MKGNIVPKVVTPTVSDVQQFLLSMSRLARASEVNWGYDGDEGPDHWGDLCPAYKMAKTGAHQSPIDIISSTLANPADLLFDYQPSALNIVNTSHTIQANDDAGSTLQVDGLTYELVQYHFHNPSENTVDGSATPMEMHLVHRNGNGDIAVVGVFLVDGKENEAYAPVFDNMPATIGEPVTIPDVSVNAADLLPVDQTYWRWDGSLTTPPCTEGVKWFMMTTPVEVSARQIDTYKALYTGNARPVQPMNERDFIIGQALYAPPTTGAVRGVSRSLLVAALGMLFVLGVAAGYTLSRHRAV